MQLSKKQIKKFRENPTLVVEQLLDIKLHWWQKFYINNICSSSRIKIDTPRNYYVNNYKKVIKMIDEIKLREEK